jgi:hypothetical protein
MPRLVFLATAALAVFFGMDDSMRRIEVMVITALAIGTVRSALWRTGMLQLKYWTSSWLIVLPLGFWHYRR